MARCLRFDDQDQQHCARSMTPSPSAPMAKLPWLRARWRSRLFALPMMAALSFG